MQALGGGRGAPAAGERIKDVDRGGRRRGGGGRILPTCALRAEHSAEAQVGTSAVPSAGIERVAHLGAFEGREAQGSARRRPRKVFRCASHAEVLGGAFTGRSHSSVTRQAARRSSASTQTSTSASFGAARKPIEREQRRAARAMRVRWEAESRRPGAPCGWRLARETRADLTSKIHSSSPRHATRSSSPSGVATRCATTRKPRERSCSAASASPRFPMREVSNRSSARAVQRYSPRAASPGWLGPEARFQRRQLDSPSERRRAADRNAAPQSANGSHATLASPDPSLASSADPKAAPTSRSLPCRSLPWRRRSSQPPRRRPRPRSPRARTSAARLRRLAA